MMLDLKMNDSVYCLYSKIAIEHGIAGGRFKSCWHRLGRPPARGHPAISRTRKKGNKLPPDESTGPGDDNPLHGSAPDASRRPLSKAIGSHVQTMWIATAQFHTAPTAATTVPANREVAVCA